MNKYLSILNRILFYGFFLYGVLVLVFGMGEHINLVFFNFGSFFASWLLSITMKKRNMHIGYAPLLINIALWANVLGESGFYYSSLTYYDKVSHLLIGILIVYLVYEYFEKNLKPRMEMIFFVTLGMFAIWEIYEYVLFAYFNYPTMGVFVNGMEIMSPLDDTMIDMICGSLGAIIYLVIKKQKIKSN